MAADTRKPKLLKLLKQFVYPTGAARGGKPARRLRLVALPDVAQGVYITTDSLSFVDYYYRELLDLAIGNSSLGVMRGGDHPTKLFRWSFFRDDLRYRAQKDLKVSPMTTRLMVADRFDYQVIVLATRQPKGKFTQISVTVLPRDEADAPIPPAPTKRPRPAPRKSR